MFQLFRKKPTVNQDNNTDMTKDNEMSERLSEEIDTMIIVSEVRLNLLRHFSELTAQLGIDDESQELDTPDKEIYIYTDSSSLPQE